MSNNHRSMREISNQYLPNKQNFQTKWVDFPNHLHPKEEVEFESEQAELKEEAIVEHYLPFSHPTHSALEEKMNPEKKKEFFNLLKKVVKEETIVINGVVFYKKNQLVLVLHLQQFLRF